MSPDESGEVARRIRPAHEPDTLRFVAVPMMTNSLQLDGLSKRHKKNEPASKKPRWAGLFYLYGNAQ